MVGTVVSSFNRTKYEVLSGYKKCNSIMESKGGSGTVKKHVLIVLHATIVVTDK